MNQVNVRALAEGVQFNRFHASVLFWCVTILILDGYELAVVGAALPSIMKDMGIDATRAGIMASSALFGTMLGAIFLGALADRIGRPRMIAACVAVFSIFTALAGLTTEPVSFSVVRFLAGLGIGGVLPVVTAQMAEFAPAHLRTRLVTLVFSGYSIGGILVALVAKQFIESHGWQSVFYAAGIPLVLVPFLVRSLPESMTFLARRGRKEELLKTAQLVNPGLGLTHPDQIVDLSPTSAQGASVKRLFEERRGSSTVMIWIAFVTGLFMVYALNSWLTKLMAMAGFSLGSALNFVLVFNLGAIVGAVGGGWLSDKFNIKTVLVSFYLLGAAALTLMGFTRSTALLVPVVFVVGASTLGTQLIAYAYAGVFYPAEIRSTGVGFASGIGRIGAIVAPVLIGWLVSLELALERNFMAIAVAGVIGGVAILLVDQRRSDGFAVRNVPLSKAAS
jgi:AAHS family benzoate transporter-like MFS transporter